MCASYREIPIIKWPLRDFMAISNVLSLLLALLPLSVGYCFYIDPVNEKKQLVDTCQMCGNIEMRRK